MIVEAVARAHGGRLRFRIAPNGCFEAALVLPTGSGPDERPSAI